MDYRGDSGRDDREGELLSLVVLVGRGWAHDDPVLTHTVMSDANRSSPMHPDGRAVEQWHSDDCGIGNVFGVQAYRPHYSLGSDSSPNGGTNRGAPALHSDHRPMGARLRIYTR